MNYFAIGIKFNFFFKILEVQFLDLIDELCFLEKNNEGNRIYKFLSFDP
jgi:hypothetical protein